MLTMFQDDIFKTLSPQLLSHPENNIRSHILDTFIFIFSKKKVWPETSEYEDQIESS